jgi:hypothetical protein
MDRGSDALKAQVADMSEVVMRQTRRGCFQEILGCEARTEFKYYKKDEEDKFAVSLEESDFCCRLFCAPIRPFKVTAKETGTEAELFTIDRPLACSPGPCKCCCYQVLDISSGGQPIGKIEEQYYYCIPTFMITDEQDKPLYKMHQPTCFGGMCVNCCAEGNPCGKGCCKASFRLYPADQEDTDGDAPFIGDILKKPKSLATELFTDAVALDVKFPPEATSDEKAIVMGASLFINALFFENDDQ